MTFDGESSSWCRTSELSGWAKTFATTTGALIIAACASAPRNPVLDKYPAGVNGRTSVVYYDVYGRTFDEIRGDMRRKGPKIDGISFVGEARSPMRWSWRTESLGGTTCSIREATVSVNAQITLPRWTPPANAEPGLETEWKRFLAALELHEAGHKDISAKAGREITNQLRGMSGLCSQLNTRANDVARTIVARAAEEQRLYDATTRHGLTQGTAFGRGRGIGIWGRSDSLMFIVGPRVGTIRAVLPVGLERVWAELPAAYAAVDLRVDAVDSAAHAVGDSMTVRGRVGAMPVSEVVDCGGLPAGVDVDSVDVALFVTSRLEGGQATDTTAVVNTVQAIARPPGVAPLACRSRAVLERRVFEALLARMVR
jgi:predicted secreted Zn-dependent protease